MLTYEQANELFHYEPSSGKLIRKVTTGNRALAGTEVACGASKNKYKFVHHNKKAYCVHRICMLLAYGECPKNVQIDHINHNRGDNRLCNLRFVTNEENSKNHSANKNNTSGITGVYYNKAKRKFQAYIMLNYRNKYIGRYDSLDDAARARKSAEFLYGYHPNHGK